MVNFKKPTIRLLFPYSVSAIFCHFIGYNIVRAILLDNSHSITNLIQGEIEYILYIFTLAEIISLVVASIVMQLVDNKFQLIVIFSVIWMLVLAIFHGSVTISSAILVAVVSSLLRVGLLSYGAGEYDSRYSSELYIYFLFTYLSIILGELGSIYYLPPNTNKCISKCYGAEFMAKNIVVSIIFGIFGTIIFYMSKFSFEYPGSTQYGSRVSAVFIARKMVYVLIIIAPFLIVWISQQQIITKWPVQAYLTTPEILSYIFDRDYVHFVYLCCIMIYVSIFYAFFYKKYSKCLTSCPFIAITIGCIVMSFAAVMTRKIGMETKQYTNKLMEPNVSWLLACALRDEPAQWTTNSSSVPHIQVSPRACKMIKFQLDSPYEYVRISEWLDPLVIEWDDVAIIFEENFLNQMYDVSKETCHRRRPDYFDPTAEPDPQRCKMARSAFTSVERPKSGLPKICVTCEHLQLFPTITLYKTSSVNQKYVGTIRYNFMCTIDQPECLLVAPGIYRLKVELRTTFENFNDAYYFEIGGIYVVHVAANFNYTDVMSNTVVGPVEISVLWLLFPIILMAAARTLIEVTGIYIIYTQSHTLFKTISIGCWMATLRSGDLVNTVYNRRYENFDAAVALKNVSHIFLYTALFFFCMAVFGIFCFKTNWAPSALLKPDAIESTNEAEEKKHEEV